MIATSNINLKVPFNEKDQAKALGARWNAEAKLWYVPQGVEVAPFEKWLGASQNTAPSSAVNSSPAQSTSKSAAKPVTQANKPLLDDLDAINASLRDAYEPNEDMF